MKPSDLSKELRRIASAIDKSRNPSKDLVLKDISAVMSRMAADEVMLETDGVFDLMGRKDDYIGFGMWDELAPYDQMKYKVFHNDKGIQEIRLSNGQVFYDRKRDGYINNKNPAWWTDVNNHLFHHVEHMLFELSDPNIYPRYQPTRDTQEIEGLRRLYRGL